MKQVKELINKLNCDCKEERLEAVRKLSKLIAEGKLPAVPRKEECNNHVHSQFSFSPYSPSMIAWLAYENGLEVCGIIDHESVAGCREFIEACKMLGVVPTIGFEVRLSCVQTPMKGKRLNNQDQLSVGYFPVHGLPVQSINIVEEFLQPIRKAREKRNRKMTEKVNQMMKGYGIELDFDRDVVSISKWSQGGSVTERHILYALALQMIEKYGQGSGVVEFVERELSITLTEKAKGYLMDAENDIYAYDLTNVLKGYFSKAMYVEAEIEETPDVKTVLPFLNRIGCIPTYIYIGDIRGGANTPDDRKIQKFEDDHLEELFECLASYGLRAISYVPSRNDMDQVVRIRQLCRKYGMFEICGEDINQPRQSFICTHKTEADRNFFNNSTRALVGHEFLAEQDLSASFISDSTIEKFPNLDERMAYYKSFKKNVEEGRK